MNNIILVILGSGLGGGARYLISTAVGKSVSLWHPHRTHDWFFWYRHFCNGAPC